MFFAVEQIQALFTHSTEGRIISLVVSQTKKNKSNENLKTAIPSNNYDRPKTTGECVMF